MISVLRLLFIAFTLFLSSMHALANARCLDLLNPTNSTLQAIEQLENIRRAEWRLGVEEKSMTTYYIHRRSDVPVRADKVIVIYHGLLNNPSYTKSLADYLFNLGYNVINVRLARHAEGRRSSLDRVKYTEWFAQSSQFADISSKLGRQTVYIGHSTGGLLAIYSLLERPKDTAGIVLISAAQQVQNRVVWQARARFLGLSGQVVDFVKKLKSQLSRSPLILERYMSTYAGKQVQLAAQSLDFILAQRRKQNDGFQTDVLFNTPALAIDTAIDNVISPARNKDLMDELTDGTHILLSETAHVEHNSTGSSKSEGNSEGDRVFDSIAEFLESI